MATIESDLLTNLTLEEIGILLLTNDGEGPNPDQDGRDVPFILTTKDSYIWSIIFSTIIINYPEYDTIDILRILQETINRRKKDILSYYQKVDLQGFDYTYISRVIISGFTIRFPVFKQHEGLNEVYKEVEEAYKSTIRRGLIKDPVLTEFLGYGLCVLGFIPHGFTQKTSKGKIVYKKIQALYWSYEKSGLTPNDQSIAFKIKIFELIKTFGSFFSTIINNEIKQTESLLDHLPKDEEEDGDIEGEGDVEVLV